ncbi:MAG: helix-turn-helix transcriptional regulator [Clostridia bacterium]|nr:helix-turn-helix transcriptional regulator [Clostridia bacterium]
MEIDKKLVGNRIKTLRLEKKLTQEDLASLLGLNNKSSISQYENGSIVPSDDIKIKICDIFNCPMEYLMGISDKKTPEKLDDEKNEISFKEDEIYIALSKSDRGYISDEVKDKILEFAKFAIEQEKKKKEGK